MNPKKFSRLFRRHFLGRIKDQKDISDCNYSIILHKGFSLADPEASQMENGYLL
jgi:hypothetical protein